MAWVNGKSGTFNISTSNSAISGYVKWQETYDVVANKSKVTLTAYLHRTNIYSGATFFYGGSVTRTAFFGSETVGSTVTTDMSIPGNTSSSGGAYVQVYTASKEISHNADGTKSITLGFSMSNNVTGVAGQSFTVPKTTATVSLTAIPRATTPVVSNSLVTMGNSIGITLSPADSSFKHKIRYEFGSLVSQINGVKVGGTQITADYIPSGAITFTPPGTLGSQIPNATSGKSKIIVYTYRSDGTHIGTKTAEVVVSVPSYMLTINCGVAGNNLLNGVYVQGKSTATVTTAAVSSYGASIKSYSTVIDGKTYTGNSITTSALSAGSKTAVVTVTDSRGKSQTYTTPAFTVYAYSAPTITGFTLVRQSDGTTVVATVKGSVASVNSKNAKTITVTLNGVTKTITSSSYTINGTATFTGVSTDSTFTGTAKIADSYTNVTKQATVPTVAVTTDYHHSGKGVAFGKVAEHENLLDVAWKIKSGKPAETLDGFSYRGVNVINSNEADTVYNWCLQGNLATAFYTEDAGLTKPSNWGLITNVTTGVGSSELHQLWFEQSGGSIFHRGGNSGGFKPWYKVLDNGNCPEYAVERGTSNGWEYTKWNSGKIELFGEKSLSFPAGTQITDNLHRSIVSIDLSGLLTKIMSGTCSIQTNGMIPQVCRNSDKAYIAEIVIATSRTISAFTIAAPVYIIGKWK